MQENQGPPTLARNLSLTRVSMVHLKIKKGLDIPLEGTPEGIVQSLPVSSWIGLDYTPFHSLQPHLLVKPGDLVSIGQPLIEDKHNPKRVWTSPAAGTIKEIFRGEKRVLQGIQIVPDGTDRHFPWTPLASSSQEEFLSFLMRTGLWSWIQMRPFQLPIHPHLKPKSIFVKALESAPFTPSAEMQVQGQEKAFQAGLSALSSFVEGKVHLVYRKGTTASCFQQAKEVIHHTAEGPHPIANPSVHIQAICPIETSADIVWTLDVWAVIAIGVALLENRLLQERVVACAGNGFLPPFRRFYRVPLGISLEALTQSHLSSLPTRVLSGDPLMGEVRPFLGHFHTVCTALLENQKRQFLHFFRLGGDKYSASRGYLSGFLSKPFSFTTSLHGEERAFIDPQVYDRVMPLQVPTVPLIKALLAQNFEEAQFLGLLEVAPEDFALPTFVCPSKIELVEIVEQGLKKHAAEVLPL